MKLVLLSLPLDRFHTSAQARAVCDEVRKKGEVRPAAPYLICAAIHRTSEERRSLCRMAQSKWTFDHMKVEEVWVYQKYVTDDMDGEILMARERGIPIFGHTFPQYLSVRAQWPAI